jgi:hypothetical protein
VWVVLIVVGDVSTGAGIVVVWIAAPENERLHTHTTALHASGQLCCVWLTRGLHALPGCCPPPPHTQGPTASMGLYVDSGSIYETPQTTGAPCAVRACVCVWPWHCSAQQSKQHTASAQARFVNVAACTHIHTTRAGATALLECLSFKASQHRDTLRIMKEVCVCCVCWVCVCVGVWGVHRGCGVCCSMLFWGTLRIMKEVRVGWLWRAAGG